MAMTERQAKQLAAQVDREAARRGPATFHAAGFRNPKGTKDWYVAVYLGAWYYRELESPDDWPKVKSGALGPAYPEDWQSHT